jgi:hypothetical protein
MTSIRWVSAGSRRLLGLLVVFAMSFGGCSAGSSAVPSTTAAAAPVSSDPAIALTAPATAKAGSTFGVSWTGKETSGDFLVIVPAGATEWVESADSPYVNATQGNPATLTAPKAAGDYEIWFLKGDTEGVEVVKARSPLKVT